MLLPLLLRGRREGDFKCWLVRGTKDLERRHIVLTGWGEGREERSLLRYKNEILGGALFGMQEAKVEIIVFCHLLFGTFSFRNLNMSPPFTHGQTALHSKSFSCSSITILCTGNPLRGKNAFRAREGERAGQRSFMLSPAKATNMSL